MNTHPYSNDNIKWKLETFAGIQWLSHYNVERNGIMWSNGCTCILPFKDLEDPFYTRGRVFRFDGHGLVDENFYLVNSVHDILTNYPPASIMWIPEKVLKYKIFMGSL